MRLRSWAACSVAIAALACTSSAGTDAVDRQELGRPAELVRALASGPQMETRCGGLEIVPRGPWTSGDPRLDWLKNTWHPRGESGRPVAIRSVHGPAELLGHQLVELELEHAPQPRMYCYIPELREPHGDGCVGTERVWRGFADTPAPPRPEDARGWAELLGTLDGATAVFESEEMLAGCVDGLPAASLANTAALGVRGPSESLTVSFVERLDPSPELSMLVVVRASLREGEQGIVREELWTVDCGAQR
jgi:hypothetical protein